MQQEGGHIVRPLCWPGDSMDNIRFYEISRDYVEYLAPVAPYLFHNSQSGQTNERKYIGVVLNVNGMAYFAPLSSFKQKHLRMNEGLDFIKVRNYAVINLNCMFPVPDNECTYVDFAAETDLKYRSLLLAEYRYIKSIQTEIRENAAEVYKHKRVNGNSTPLARRCNDFALLETMCAAYKLRV